MDAGSFWRLGLRSEGSRIGDLGCAVMTRHRRTNSQPCSYNHTRVLAFTQICSRCLCDTLVLQVRSAVQQDNVGTRLEKMYNRVLKSQYLTDDPGSVTWGVQAGSGGGAGGGRGGAGGLSQVASGTAPPGLNGSPSGPVGNGAGGGGSPGGLRKVLAAGGTSQRRLGGPGGMSISIHDDSKAGPGPGSEVL